MATNLIYFVITTAITIAIGIISYFLKRTMDKIDKLEEEVLPEKYEKDGVYADVIVVDPPRKGCDETLLSTMLQMKPKRIVYVSCDSATLARDLKILCEENYQLEKVAVCDMFPSSVHVETVACLERK